MKKTVILYVLVPLLVAAAFSAMHFAPFLETTENRMYDTLLRLKEPIEENDRIVLLNIGDEAVVNVGVWPWSRDIVARGLILLREFEARTVSLDIEYVEESPLGVNASVLNEDIPQLFEQEFSQIRGNITDLFTALAQGQIDIEEAESFVQDLTSLTAESRSLLLDRVADIARDNDELMGRTARLNGSAYFTVNMLSEPDPVVRDRTEAFAREHFTVDPAEDRAPDGTFAEAGGIRPTILPILENAAGIGFVNVWVDPDGVRRRVNLLYEHDDAYYPQLALSPVLDVLGNPEVITTDDRIILEDAEYPDGTVTDVSIPLTETGHALVHWPAGEFDETYRHESYYRLVIHEELESRLVENLRVMADAGYFNYYDGEFEPLQAYDYAEDIKADVLDGGDPAQMDEYVQVRAAFFDAVGDFLGGSTEEAIIADLERVLEQEDIPDDLRADYETLIEEIPVNFSSTGDVYERITDTRERLREAVTDAMVFIGLTATGTVDIGVTPFSERYANVGTHASVANMILENDFLDSHPLWYSIVAAFALALLVAALIRRLDPLPSIIVGVVSAAVFLAAGGVYFMQTGVYFPLLTPALSIFFTFLTITAVKFIQTAQERSYIRNAFSHYLSTDVINDLLSDPSKLSLGGEKKYLTAFFTDVKGFSTISEGLDPTDLVKLLNSYLTEMSNIILDQRGTIDKYEGDAIISFFGAPVEFSDHAARACLSAVRMKKMERILNEHITSENLSPNPLHTRIGINTGEMVVGNMGTAQKMDYTMMGNSVNLAARLEGVNKQYGTWILVSETTRNEAGDDFIFRRLDRVRVVGINRPVRLFELVDERALADGPTTEALDAFEEGLTLFEQREWERAHKHFEQTLAARPDDGPATFFAKRCKDFQKKAPPANWDGVFNLNMK
ncbi:MAG: CHASE2 domain-containing protein [Spirochaetaceae bacterium]